MQSPTKITISDSQCELKYGILERVSNADTLTNFLNASFANLTASNYGSDPVLQIPPIVNNYRSLIAYIKASAIWLCGSTVYTTPRLNLQLKAYNQVVPSASLIKQNGEPLLSLLTSEDSIPLSPMAGTLDFSNVSVCYAIDPSFNFTGFSPITAFAAHNVLVYFSVLIIANGTN